MTRSAASRARSCARTRRIRGWPRGPGRGPRGAPGTLRSCGSALHALRKPDDVALGVGEEGDLDRAGLHRRHHRLAAGLLDTCQRALEIIRLDVNGEHPPAVARLSDAAADAVTVRVRV